MHIYKKSLPFITFENDHWKKFVSKAMPGFITPTPHQLRTSLLDSLYEIEMTKTLERIGQADCITLGIDESKIGRSNRINFIACIPQPFFLKSFDADGVSLTCEFLSERFLYVVTQFNLDVKAVITDNGANICKLRQQLENTGVLIASQSQVMRHLRCLAIYCICHGLNLLVKDFMKDESVEDDFLTATKVANLINSSAPFRRLFTSRIKDKKDQAGGEKNKLDKKHHFNLPPAIRWQYHHQFLTDFIRYREPVQSIFFFDKQEFDREFEKSKRQRFDYMRLKDDDYWERLEEMNKVITPLCEAIIAGESTSSTISSAYIMMEQIRSKQSEVIEFMVIKKLNAEKFTKMLDKRYKQIKLAAFLDPKYHEKKIAKLSYAEAKQLITVTARVLGFDDEVITNMISDLQKYLLREDPFTEDAFQSVGPLMTSSRWWMLHGMNTALSQLAQILVNIPASNASVERSFSHQSLVFDRRRRSLTHGRLEKLTKLKFDSQERKVNSKQSHLESLKIWNELRGEELESEFPSLLIEDELYTVSGEQIEPDDDHEDDLVIDSSDVLEIE